VLRILIFVHLGPRILDPGYKNSKKREGRKKICCPPFFCSHKYHKIENYFNFKLMKKKIWSNLARIIELSTHKIVMKLSKIWVWDPRSGKTYSGSRGQKRHRIPNPGSGTLPLASSNIVLCTVHWPNVWLQAVLHQPCQVQRHNCRSHGGVLLCYLRTFMVRALSYVKLLVPSVVDPDLELVPYMW
jgi:hypothetical protein